MKRITDITGVFRIQLASMRRERSEEHTSELQSRLHLVCRLLLEKKTLDTEPAGEMTNKCTPPPAAAVGRSLSLMSRGTGNSRSSSPPSTFCFDTTCTSDSRSIRT